MVDLGDPRCPLGWTARRKCVTWAEPCGNDVATSISYPPRGLQRHPAANIVVGRRDATAEGVRMRRSVYAAAIAAAYEHTVDTSCTLWVGSEV